MRQRLAWLATAVVMTLAWKASATPQRTFVISGNSQVEFRSFGVSVEEPVQGTFGAVSAALAADPRDLSDAHGHVSVLLGSIRTRDPSWDALFRAAPFLALSDYPRATFTLDKIEDGRTLRPNTTTNLTLVGRMRLRDVERKVRVAARAEYMPAGAKRSASGRDRIRVRGDLVLRFADYGIHVPKGPAREAAGEGAKVRFDLWLKARR